MKRYGDVEFGEDLPELVPDTGVENVTRFARAAGMLTGRFTDHEEARKEGLPGAIVPGIMSQALLASMIHQWAPNAEIRKIDTVFRATVMVDENHRMTGVVTDMDDDEKTVEIDLTLQNEAGETRVMGTATVVLPD